MKALKFGAAVLAVMALGYTTSAMAADCNGRWTNVDRSAENIDLGDGHTLTVFSASGSITSDNSPFNAVGMCGGHVLTTPDGESYMSYACTRRDVNGDSFSDKGGMNPGDTSGTWTQSGGTGVFADTNGSGTWQVVFADGGVTAGTFEGNCE